MTPEFRRPSLFPAVFLAALAGCGSHQSAPAVPSPQAAPTVPASTAPASDQASAAPQPVAGAVAPSDTAAAEADTALADSAAAFDSAAATSDETDSAADAAMLDKLANATPGDSLGSDSAAPASTGGAKAISSGATWDIDVNSFQNHERVQFYLDFFQGPARDRMAIWLQRLPRYDAMIRSAFAAESLPGDLEYLALIESGFSNSATSRARAVGMWQFMKGTGRMYGLRIDKWVDERRDPIKATPAAARYLKDLQERFGSLYLAAAAYNAGGGRVSRGLARLEDDDGADDEAASDSTFFRLYDTRYLRRETRDYVPKLIAAALIAKEPERYGFTAVSPAAPFAYDSIVVPDATGLDVIAHLADTSIQAIRELNPQYLRMATPPDDPSVVRVPVGAGEKVAEGYAELPPSRRLTFHEHFVSKGETIGAIALHYHVSQEDIRLANPKVSPKRLRIGMRLIIPVSGVAFDPRAAALAEEPDTPRRRHATGATHLVRNGESWWTISREYGVTISNLRKWNDAGPAASLRIGQRIRVSGGTAAVAARRSASSRPRSAAASGTHKVRYGETLSGLAERYGVTLAALRRLNAMAPGEPLRSGMVLRIPDR